jgi:hypothetical protein
MRAAMSRNVRSRSARCSISARDRPSSAMSRVLVMATAAWSARPPSTAASIWSNWAALRRNTSIVPSGPSSPMIGAAISERMLLSRARSSFSGVWTNASEVR